MPRRGSSQVFLNEEEAGATYDKGLLYLHIHKYMGSLEMP